MSPYVLKVFISFNTFNEFWMRNLAFDGFKPHDLQQITARTSDDWMSYLNVRVFSRNKANRPNKGPERLSRRHCCNLNTFIRQTQYHLITHCSALFRVISFCVRVGLRCTKCLCACGHLPDCWLCWNEKDKAKTWIKLMYLYGVLSVWMSATMFHETLYLHMLSVFVCCNDQ